MIEQNQGDCKGLQTIARAFAIGVGALITVAFVLLSYSIGHAGIHPTAQEIAACGGDAQRLCTAEIKTGTVLACLQAHRAALSKLCAALLLEKSL
jgi:hypothetical protein